MSKISPTVNVVILVLFTLLLKVNLVFSKGKKFPNLENESNVQQSVNTSLVEDVVQKICNLTLDEFLKSDPGKLAKLLMKIEDKLNKSAESFGFHSKENVSHFMDTIKLQALSNQRKQANGVHKTASSVVYFRAHPKKHEHHRSKRRMIRNIARKLNILTRVHLKKAKTDEERQKILNDVKNKFKKLIGGTDTKKRDIQIYINLISEGIDVMEAKDDNLRRAEYKSSNKINAASLDTTKTHVHEFDTNELEDVVKGINPLEYLSNVIDTNSSESFCDKTLKSTCEKVKSLNIVECHSDKMQMSVVKMCDGVDDCIDFSDERDCGRKAMESVQSANRIIANIENSISHKCFVSVVDNDILNQQNEILMKVLQRQLDFLQKHTVFNNSSHFRRVFIADTPRVKTTVNEIATVISTLSSALQAAICTSAVMSDKVKTEDHKVETTLSDYQAEDLPKQSKRISKCKCKDQFCTSSCTPVCKEMCMQKYTLSRWRCQAVGGENSISLDLICDGKLDCYDESDESSCNADSSVAKFEAPELYNKILMLIARKSASMTQVSVRNKLLTLLGLVQYLQKLNLRLKLDVVEIRYSRDACFSELSSIYNEVLSSKQVATLEQSADMYVFLMTINMKLVNALKRTHTGNDRLISADGCYCRQYQCASPKCSKICSRACSAEPTLTRYFCAGSSNFNNSIPINFLCDGSDNCPSGDDEKNCMKEVCRTHHLIMLRQNLRDVGESEKGTVIGEALRAWKLKVTATLQIAEKSERPLPSTLRNIIQDILHDLVMTYADINGDGNNNRKFRSQNSSGGYDTALPVFHRLSQIVMDTVKSCGQ